MQEDLTGAAFHPLDDNLLITHGRGHLTFWNRRKDGFFERTDIIKPVSTNGVNIMYTGWAIRTSLHMNDKNSSEQRQIIGKNVNIQSTQLLPL